MNDLVCRRCNVPLEETKVRLTYLGHEFFAELPCCPKCGQVLIDEDTVKGKMRQLEMTLEEK